MRSWRRSRSRGSRRGKLGSFDARSSASSQSRARRTACSGASTSGACAKGLCSRFADRWETA
jgi:hypothetical protein